MEAGYRAKINTNGIRIQGLVLYKWMSCCGALLYSNGIE
jgi:hypothetical protein